MYRTPTDYTHVDCTLHVNYTNDATPIYIYIYENEKMAFCFEFNYEVD